LGSVPRTAEQVAEALGADEHRETVYLLLEHLEANGRAVATEGEGPERAFCSVV
jgi:hypothetical protein